MKELDVREAAEALIAECVERAATTEAAVIAERHIAAAMEKAEEAEQVRWQKRIDVIVREHAPDADGSGTDTGDPLDVTEAEIAQTINHVAEKAREGMVSVEALSEAMEVMNIPWFARARIRAWINYKAEAQQAGGGS